MQNSEWITIRKACEISNKPEITIRRLVKRLLKDKSKNSRNIKIDNSVSSSKYLLNKQFVLDLYSLNDDQSVNNQRVPEDKSDDVSVDKLDINHELINLLKQELIEKNKQIEKLQDTLKNQQVLNLEMTRYLDKVALPVAETIKKNDAEDKEPDKTERSKPKKRWWF
jgi:hypothetical protein